MKLDRPAAGHDGADVLAADEAQVGVVEIIAAEIVDHGSGGARGHEGIDVDALVHEDSRAAGGLIGVIASDHSLAGAWVIGLADA